jgi:hypothetical protein
MLRDYFTPEEPEEDRPIMDQCRRLNEALIQCSQALAIIPKNYRFDLADAISTMANTYVMLNDMHNAYMEEFEKVNGPIEHKE